MKNITLFFVALIISLTSFAGNVDGENPKAEKVEIYKGLFLNMNDNDVHNYLKYDLKAEETTEGKYAVKFLDQDALLEPVFVNNQLAQIKIVYESDDIELIECNLKMIEKSLSTSSDWKIHKASDYQWLIEKSLDKTIEDMNQITMFTYGIHRDNVGHGWHAEVIISPRFEAKSEFSEETLNSAKSEIESSL
ncbi:hypothetical protein [Flammeovirga pacifica]|uniref:Uncharacterized protein n=1 Tax=Flammeovirga pacifica TaxID=915059 RepID=A0A1S1YT83_FLAPC|nr:hypothetical protein [Flammeovirga pacifica]OHX64015.1 hypothetical protein NH26_20620 [Flammeovirga pacifica]